MGQQFGFLAEKPSFFGEVLFKGHRLFESSALLHDATSGPNRGVRIPDSLYADGRPSIPK
jgi:hypothetical protein